MKFAIAPLLAAALSAPSAHAELQGRDLDAAKAGYEAYYDTALDITWLAVSAGCPVLTPMRG